MFYVNIFNSTCQVKNLDSRLDKILKRELRYKDPNTEFSLAKNEREIKKINNWLDSGKFSNNSKLEKRLAQLLHINRGLKKKLFVSLYRDGEFPTGLLPLVKEIMQNHDMEYELVDNRKKPQKKKHKFVLKQSFPALRYYQKDATKALMEQGGGRGIIVMPTGCHAKGTKVLMFDGTFKKVEDVAPGDLLMGPDSTPRTVQNLCRGRQQMAKIIPNKGKPFIVNIDHILSLKSTNEGKDFPCKTTGNEIINISVKDYLKKSKSFQHLYKLYRTGVDFEIGGACLEIPPYILGLWLGAGSSGQSALTTMDNEIRETWNNWGLKLKMIVKTHDLPNNKAKTYSLIKSHEQIRNPINIKFNKYNLLHNKHIPYDYKISSKKARLELLAGIIDTDGSKSSNSSYDIIQKREKLIDDVAYVARSLGFAAYKSTKLINNIPYYRLSISGDVYKIPVKLTRKVCNERRQKKDVLKTGFKVELLPEANYYGFTLDKDHLYLLEDFTVTHNTGKTMVVSKMIWDLGVNTLVITPNKSITDNMMSTLKHHFGKGKVEKLTTKTKKIKKPINVVNIQALVKINPNVLKDIDAVFIDEFHHAAADTYREVNLKHLKNCYYRIGVTATNFRNDGADMALESVLSNVLYTYTIKQAIKEGYLVKPEFEIVDTEVWDDGNYQETYKSAIVENEARNNLIADIAKEEFENNKHIIILVQQIEHGEKLQKMLEGSEFIHGNVKDLDREKLMENFRKGKYRILIGTSVIGEGVDLPIADTLIMAGGGKAKSQVLQNVGRVLRTFKGKLSALIIDFTDEGSRWLTEHSIIREEIYNEYYP